jgi:hypothetical protein
MRRVGNHLRFDDWGCVDPESDALGDAIDVLLHEPAKLTFGQQHMLHGAVAMFCHFATHPAGTESMVAQLRELRRGLKETPLSAEPGAVARKDEAR